MSPDRPNNPYAPPRSTVADVGAHDAAAPPRPRFGIPLLLLIAATAVWCVALPFLWAYNLAARVGVSYLTALAVFMPELAAAAITAASLGVVAIKPRGAAAGLVAASVLLLGLRLYAGGDTSGAWPFTVSLLSLLAARLHVRFKPAA